MPYPAANTGQESLYTQDALRLEAVTTCVGFDDLLDETLTRNHAHLDTAIVVTSHDDNATHKVALKHGATLVQTDLFRKNQRCFNKGAAVNAGFNRFQYHGWRMHLDCDIALPDNFRRLLFNHSHLDRNCLYGADRVDVIGTQALEEIFSSRQHFQGVFLAPNHDQPLSPRFVDPLYGYCPLGFFQLWHAKTQKPYPYSLGTAAHDDIMFAAEWPEAYRRLLPSAICYHLCAKAPHLGENWEGRRQPRLDS